MLRTLTHGSKHFVRRTASFLMGAAVVLLYHRVYDPDFDPQLLSVSSENFDTQIGYLRRRYAVLGLDELRAGLAKGSVPRGAVAVTFDDGYGDNFRNAWPILERHHVPATIFVTTGYTDSGREFWWDDLARTMFFAPKLPERLSLDVNGATREWTLGAAARMSVEERLADRGWTILREDNPTEVHRVYRELQPILLLAPPEQRDRMLADLRAQTRNGTSDRFEESQLADPLADNLAMTREQLRSIARTGLIGIGAHTVTHPVLSALPPESAAREIRQSKEDLQQILGGDVVSFAYPYGYRGAYTPQNVSDVRAAGLADAYSNFGGAVRPHANRYELNRILVRDWSLDEFGRMVGRAFGD
jgi:peptidoglycan/xylan/chitin deacetylase (PgdA/CDA1 family)